MTEYEASKALASYKILQAQLARKPAPSAADLASLDKARGRVDAATKDGFVRWSFVVIS